MTNFTPGAPLPPVSRGAAKGPVRTGRVIGGILLILLIAIPFLIGGILAMTLGVWASARDPEAEGRAPGTLTFEAKKGADYVVALGAGDNGSLFDGLSRSERRAEYRVYEGEQSDARCTVTHEDGSTNQLRGDRQVSSTSIGTRYASIGKFTGEGGETTVECHFDPTEDLIGNVTESPLMVHAENETLQLVGWGLLIGSLLFGLLGTWQILRGTVWRKLA